MKLDELYSVHSMPKKKSNNLLKLFILIVLVLLISFSLARYTGMNQVNFLVDVAKFNISINDTLISNNVSNINNLIDLKVDENITDDGLIKCGQKGHFDIKIDPQNTEVSLKYKITFSKTTLPQNFVLTGYSLLNDDDSTIFSFINDNTIISDILELNEKDKLDVSDVKIYRIYWQWLETNDIPVSNYAINANIFIEQKID